MIHKAQSGDSDALAELFSAYKSRLFGYFFRATGNRHDADDLLSEVALRLVRTLSRYRHQGRFEPWLFRMAANLVRDRIRRKKTRPNLASLSATDEDGNSMAQRVEGAIPAVDANMLAGESREELQAALSQLDDTTREMILLRHFADMSFKEIAQQFDCPLGTALAKVHRGLKALKGIMIAQPP